MKHFNFRHLDWDEVLKKLHPFILKAFCYIVGVIESILLFVMNLFFWDPFFPSYSKLLSFFSSFLFPARFMCMAYIIKKIPPITDKPKYLFHITLLLAVLVFISNFFIIFRSYYPIREKQIFSWLDTLFFVYTTSFTGYIALIHSIQLFHPNKRKSIIINTITSLMMIYWLVDFFIK